MKKLQLFISGIDTDIGKTFCTALLCKAMKADYWKPVQAGGLDNSDTMVVQEMTGLSEHHFFPETFRLQSPMSPHAAAIIDGIEIKLSDFELPKSERDLLVEGAGGLIVPINEKDTVLDLAKNLNIGVILVIKNYLGSINHSCLSVDSIMTAGLNIAGIIINGERNEDSERFILNRAGNPPLLHVEEMQTKEEIESFCESEEMKIFISELRQL